MITEYADRTPSEGHGYYRISLLRRPSTSASYLDDRIDDDLRYASVDVCEWSRRNGNSSLGTGVVGGMAIGTLALLFVVPVFYIAFEFLQEKIRKPMEVEADLQVLQEQEKSANERENHK